MYADFTVADRTIGVIGRIDAGTSDRGAGPIEKRLEARGHQSGRGHGRSMTVDKHFDVAAHVHDLPASGKRIEVFCIEDVPLIRLVQHDDRARVFSAIRRGRNSNFAIPHHPPGKPGLGRRP